MTNSQFEWITKEFAANLVRKVSSTENLTIDSVQIEEILAKGENSSSGIRRLNIQYTDESKLHQKLSFVQKSKSTEMFDGDDTENIEYAESFQDMAFGKEIVIYTDFASEIERALSSINTNSSIIPK